MAHIFEEGDVTVHIHPGIMEPLAHCYDERDQSFRTVVVIDLLAFLPTAYGEEEEDNQIPSWQFVIEAMQVCAERGRGLWSAWEELRNELP